MKGREHFSHAEKNGLRGMIVVLFIVLAVVSNYDRVNNVFGSEGTVIGY